MPSYFGKSTYSYIVKQCTESITGVSLYIFAAASRMISRLYIKYLNPSSINRDLLWQSFLTLCSSEDFTKLWEKLLSEAKVNPTPTLYQQLTTLMFNEEVRKAIKLKVVLHKLFSH